MRHLLFGFLAACVQPPTDSIGEQASAITTHPPATAADLAVQPTSDGAATSNIATWPTGSTRFGAISESPPANPPDQSLVKTAVGTGSGSFTVGLPLASGFDVGQLAVHVQHSLGNGASSGAIRVAVVYAGSEIATQSVPSTTTWTTSTLVFPRAVLATDITDARQLQLRFYLDNTTAGGAGNVRVAWTSAEVWKLKPVIAGAMTVGYALPNYNKVPATVHATALNIAWSQLEPDGAGDQHYTGQDWTGPGWATIDSAIASTGGNLHGIRLRVMAGEGAPGFVKGLCTKQVGCAQGVSVTDPQNGNAYCVPCFWQANYQRQYEELMREIARRYDGVDAIREVVDSGCMTTFAEPFVRAHSHKQSNDNLIAAGYTFAGDQACHEAALDVAQGDFIRTRTSIALNPWDEPCTGCNADDANHSFSDTATLVLDDPHGRPSLGRKLVLQSNHLNWAYKCNGGDSYSSDACLLEREAGPKGFQTTMDTLMCANHDASCDTYAITINGTLQGLKAALEVGASPDNGWFVEIPTGFAWSTVDLTDFATRSANLANNAN